MMVGCEEGYASAEPTVLFYYYVSSLGFRSGPKSYSSSYFCALKWILYTNASYLMLQWSGWFSVLGFFCSGFQ